ncbi:hypothetical protein, partial [Niallia taxi]|uniref:hypothetical protein n=1 Tax=Niallia taxi TaxID=2499688 RepID=UPI003D2BCC8F
GVDIPTNRYLKRFLNEVLASIKPLIILVSKFVVKIMEYNTKKARMNIFCSVFELFPTLCVKIWAQIVKRKKTIYIRRPNIKI